MRLDVGNELKMLMSASPQKKKKKKSKENVDVLNLDESFEFLIFVQPLPMKM